VQPETQPPPAAPVAPAPEPVAPAPEPVAVAAPVWPAAGAPAPQLVAEARASLGGIQAELAELERFRVRLEHSARELMEEYQRVLDGMQARAAARTPAPVLHAPPAPQVHPPPPLAPPSSYPPPVQQQPPGLPDAHAASIFEAPLAGAPAYELPQPYAPELQPPDTVFGVQQTPVLGPPPAAAPVVPALPGQAPAAAFPAGPVPPVADVTVSGHVTVDAGPFTDIATLSAFEQAIGRIPGAEDVYVRGFEGNRAHIDVDLGTPVALGGALRERLSFGLDVLQTAPGQVRVDLHAA
jgi:hypothetical protein